MKPEKVEEGLSELELAIQNRERKAYPFEIKDMLGGTGKPLGKVEIRVATVAEQETAMVKAREYIAEKAKEDQTFLNDPDIVENAKTAHILHQVCRRPATNAYKGPAFQSPAWMLQNFGAVELGSILNAYNEVVRVSRPEKPVFHADFMRAFAKHCSENSGSKEPNEWLEQLNSQDVAEMLVCMAIMYHEATREYKKPDAPMQFNTIEEK